MEFQVGGKRVYIPIDDGECGSHPTPHSKYIPYGKASGHGNLLTVDIASFSAPTKGKESEPTKDQFCDRCAAISIDNLFPKKEKSATDFAHVVIVDDYEDESGQDEEAMEWLMDLGVLGPSLRHSPCPLCRLFYAVKMRRAQDPDNCQYYLYNLRPPIPFFWLGGRVLAIIGKQDVELQRKLYSSHVPHVRCISCANSGVSKAHEESLPLRHIQPSSINYRVLQSWVNTCRESHVDKCGDAGNAPKALKVIDCVNLRVLRASPEWNYVALSYLWGRPRPSDDHRVINGRLPQPLPNTIADAMEVTRQMGYRYLWVDRYCIDQNDEAEKLVQIKQMDLVYKHAELTIIAAAGDDPSFGLPGVSSTARLVPPTAWVDGHQLASFPLAMDVTIKESSWMTRGWTYQEGFLSRRRLVFTESQVYFECRYGAAYETVAARLGPREFTVFAEANKDTENHPWLILSNLRDFCGRKLSYEGDAIRAFEGIFHDFRTRKYPVFQYQGIPIMPPIEQDGWKEPIPAQSRRSDRFMVGLRWMNARPGKRRTRFPSWSWSGWEVELRHLDWLQHLNDEKRGNHQVSVERLDGMLRDFDNDEHFAEMVDHPERFSKFIQFTAWTIPMKIQHVSQIKKTHRPRQILTSPFLKYKSDYFAIFEQHEIFYVEAAAYPLHDSCDRVFGPKEFAPNFNTNKVIGIIFGEHEEAFADHRSGKRTFILIAYDCGMHYERIGQIELSMAMLSNPLEGLFFGYGLPKGYLEGPFKGRGPWEACFVGRQKRNIRLG